MTYTLIELMCTRACTHVHVSICIHVHVHTHVHVCTGMLCESYLNSYTFDKSELNLFVGTEILQQVCSFYGVNAILLCNDVSRPCFFSLRLPPVQDFQHFWIG